MSTPVILEWNVFTGHNSAEVNKTLRELIKAYNPHVIVLLEAAHQELHFQGYRLFQENPIPQGPGNLVHEEGDTAVLIRNDVKVIRNRVNVMTEPWIGPKNDWPHTPRRYWSFLLKIEGKTWKLNAGHWPTGGLVGRNKKALQETVTFAAKWFTYTILRRAAVLIGDLNVTGPEMQDFCQANKLKQVGRGPDRALFKNCNSINFRKLSNFGSDHPAYIFSFTK